MEILASILGAVVGSLLTFGLPYMTKRKKHRGRSDLLGRWESEYLLESTGKWVQEEVEIGVKGSHFQINSESNPIGDLYEATAILSNGELSGTWQAKRGHAGGSFLLTVSPAVEFLYGYYTGPRDSGERVFMAWVLGKTHAHTLKGRELLLSQSMAEAKLPATQAVTEDREIEAS